jgi:hypothetical protein
MLSRAKVSRRSGSWSEHDFDVFDGDRQVGCVVWYNAPTGGLIRQNQGFPHAGSAGRYPRRYARYLAGIRHVKIVVAINLTPSLAPPGASFDAGDLSHAPIAVAFSVVGAPLPNRSRPRPRRCAKSSCRRNRR